MFIELTDDQQDALYHCKNNKQYGVFFDMGMGKTAIMLSLIDYLAFETLEVSSVLIIAPPQVINKSKVWQDEIKKWKNFEFFDFIELNGSPIVRMEKKNKGFTIHLMSDMLVDWYYKTYGHLKDYDMIIIDESSRFKSPQSKKFKAMAKMLDHTKHRIYLLTGTPMPKDYGDLWSQIYLLDGGVRLGTNFYQYRNAYGFLVGQYKYVYPKSNRAIIQKKINDICMFKENIEGLPKKNEHQIMLRFDEKKQKAFNDFKESYILELKKGDITVMSKQALINKCLQLSNGNIYIDKDLNYERFDYTKWQWVYKFLDENPDKNVLIYYNFKSDKDMLLKLPRARAIEKYNDVRDWNDGKIKVGIISPFSFQYGANLQKGGHTVIWFGLVWSLENFLQANKRVWRFGQTHDVDIYYLLIENTFDLNVYRTLVSKEMTQRDFLESIRI